MSSNTNSKKVSIVGCGRVGMTSAFALVMDGEIDELVLKGRCAGDLIGEELDIEHGMPFTHHALVHSTEDYADLAESDIVIIAAGSSQKPGDTRLDLATKNVAILEDILPQVLKHAPDAIILIVSNPVDVLTYKAFVMADLPKGRIFGTGTMLDTSRFRFHLSESLKVNANSIHAYILGEHGDSSFPVLSSANIGGQPLAQFPHYSETKIVQAFDKAQTAAARIIASKGSTYYGISVVVARLVKAILRDEGAIFPVSVPLHQYHGLNGVALSVPCVIGRNGVEEVLEVKLNWQEKQQLAASAKKIREYI